MTRVAGLALALAALLAAATTRPASAAGERPIRVEAPGWTAVRLDPVAAFHAAASDLALEGPDGAAVPFRVEDDEETSRRPVEILRVEAAPDAWKMVLDVGPSPPRHTRLTFAVAQTTVAEVELEAGDDPKRFSPLATAGLFHLGEGTDLERSAVDYPATGARYLRLLWPRSAELPRVERAEVETVGDARALEAVEPRCTSEGTALDCAFEPLPLLSLVRRLEVDLAAEGAVGYRLLVVDGGRERVAAEGTRRRLDGALQLAVAASSGELRLRLYGGGATPRVAAARLLVARPGLYFRAPSAGTYLLSWATGGEPATEAAPPDGRVAWIEPGEATPRPEAALAASLVAPGAALPDVRWQGSWTVDGGGLDTGTLVRVEIPDAVLAALPAGDLGSLRLDAGGRQVPFVVSTAPRPTIVVARRGVQPQREEASGAGPALPGTSVRLAVPPASRLDELVLESTAGPFSRPLRLTAHEPHRPGVPDRLTDLAYATWDCDARPPLPCRLALPLPERLARPELLLSLDDGDNAPVASLDLAVLGHTDVVLFVWPGETVILRAAAATLLSPRYDLERRRTALLAREARSAMLVAGEPPAPTASWTRWALPLLLGVAALALVAVFGRMLRAGG